MFEKVRFGGGPVRSGTVQHGPRSGPVRDGPARSTVRSGPVHGSARSIFGRREDQPTVGPDRGRARSGPRSGHGLVRSGPRSRSGPGRVGPCGPFQTPSRYRGRRVPFSCFARPDSFSAVTRASGPVFMFCTPGLVFVGTEGGGSYFHVFRAHTHFRRYQGRRVPFECFARPDSFWPVPRASGPVFLLCAPVRVFGGTEGVGSCFLVLLPELVIIGTEGDMSCFLVLRAD
jgi:hypothetical protein